MDAEHRHELKESDLAHFLANVGPWWKKHGLKTMVVILVVLLAIIIFRTSKQRTVAQHDDTWSRLGTAATPNEFLELVLSVEEPSARALAYLAGASAFNTRAALPITGDEGVNREQALEQADRLVRELIDAEETPPLIRLNAMLLAGAIEENRGNFDAAKAKYQAVLDHPDINGEPAIATRARFRLDFVPTLSTTRPFGPEPAAIAPALPPVDDATAIPPAPADPPDASDDDGS